jgi:hypothetical protein
MYYLDDTWNKITPPLGVVVFSPERSPVLLSGDATLDYLSEFAIR